jgi:hypothetical protein
MKSHDVIRHILTQVSAKQVADGLGVSLSLVYKWAESPLFGSGTSNPLDRAELLLRLADKVAIQWLCKKLDGYFAPNAKCSAHTDAAATSLASLGAAVSEIGVALGEFCKLAGKKPTAQMLRSLRTRWDAAKSAAEGFILDAEYLEAHPEVALPPEVPAPPALPVTPPPAAPPTAPTSHSAVTSAKKESAKPKRSPVPKSSKNPAKTFEKSLKSQPKWLSTPPPQTPPQTAAPKSATKLQTHKK